MQSTILHHLALSTKGISNTYSYLGSVEMMSLTREELEKSICNNILLISRAKQQGDSGLENKYNEELKLLELSYADMNIYATRVPSYDG